MPTSPRNARKKLKRAARRGHYGWNYYGPHLPDEEGFTRQLHRAYATTVALVALSTALLLAAIYLAVQ